MGLNPLLGRYTTVEVAPITFNVSTGAYTIGSYVAIPIRYRKPHSTAITKDTENINGLGYNKNPVPTEFGGELSFDEILRNQLASSVLKGIHSTTDYIAVKIIAGGKQEVWRCLIVSDREQINKGESTYGVTLQTIDDGAANPTVTTI